MKMTTTSIGSERLSSTQSTILRYFTNRGTYGYTSEELHDLHFPFVAESTPRTRIAELVSLGKIKNSGSTRNSRNGRRMIVWVLA
jgi:hypothetical protein